MPTALALVHDLAAAIAADDPEATFAAATALAERIGTAAATALAAALVADARPRDVTLPIGHAPAIASCA